MLHLESLLTSRGNAPQEVLPYQSRNELRDYRAFAYRLYIAFIEPLGSGKDSTGYHRDFIRLCPSFPHLYTDAIMRTVILRNGLVALVILVMGCDFPSPPQTITISGRAAPRPSKPSDTDSVEDAMATVMAICREELPLLPAADPIQILLYKNTASFASYGQGWRSLPIDVDLLSAFTQKSTIHINMQKTYGKQWGPQINLLAHEYGHALQGMLSNRYTPHWFSEGFASWVEARVLHALGWQDYAVALEHAKLELINHHARLLTLGELDWQWQYLADNPHGYLETYVLAFFATARLIETHGLPATVDYIKSGDFAKSFHLSYQAFIADFTLHLSSLIPEKKADDAVIEKPEWKIGDQWIYAVRYPGDKPLTIRTIVREDKFEGVGAYVMKAEGGESFHSKKTLERLAAVKGRELTSKRHSPSHYFAWPLTLGKRWSNSYSWENVVTKNKYKPTLSMVVSDLAKVTVPAGTFLAARVQGYDARTGRLVQEYWYSPATKWIIKFRDYSDIAFREEELMSFTIK